MGEKIKNIDNYVVPGTIVYPAGQDKVDLVIKSVVGIATPNLSKGGWVSLTVSDGTRKLCRVDNYHQRQSDGNYFLSLTIDGTYTIDPHAKPEYVDETPVEVTEAFWEAVKARLN